MNGAVKVGMNCGEENASIWKNEDVIARGFPEKLLESVGKHLHIF